MTTLDTEHAAVEIAEAAESQKPFEQVLETRPEDAMPQIAAVQPKTAQAMRHAAELMSFWAENEPAGESEHKEDVVEFEDGRHEAGFLDDFAADSAVGVGDLDVGSGGGGGGDVGGGGPSAGAAPVGSSGGSGQSS